MNELLIQAAHSEGEGMPYDAIGAPVESLETLAVNGQDTTGDDDW